jgi:hypothetical protein
MPSSHGSEVNVGRSGSGTEDVVSGGVVFGVSLRGGAAGVVKNGGGVVTGSIGPVAIAGVGSPVMTDSVMTVRVTVPAVCVTVCVTTDDRPPSVGGAQAARTATPTPNIAQIALLFMAHPFSRAAIAVPLMATLIGCFAT